MRLARGLNPDGEAAWVGTFADATPGVHVCFLAWKTQIGIAETIHSQVTSCPLQGTDGRGMTLRAVRQLLVVVLVVVGLLAAIAALWSGLGSATAHRAFTLVFVAGGGMVLLVAVLTSGAESRVGGRGGMAWGRRNLDTIRTDERILNPSGALGVAGLVAIGLSIAFSIVL